jgi:hypothetical protein
MKADSSTWTTFFRLFSFDSSAALTELRDTFKIGLIFISQARCASFKATVPGAVDMVCDLTRYL